MIRLDLDAAGVPFAVDGPEGVEHRDFHALRNCYISNVIRTGADLKQAMTLARHSDPKLTAGRYARTRLFDLGAVVNKLPTPADLATEATSMPLRATGTEGGCPSDALPDALTGGAERVRLRVVEEMTDTDISDSTRRNRLESQALGEDRVEVRTEEERAASGIRTLDPSFTKAFPSRPRVSATVRVCRNRLGDPAASSTSVRACPPAKVALRWRPSEGHFPLAHCLT